MTHLTGPHDRARAVAILAITFGVTTTIIFAVWWSRRDIVDPYSLRIFNRLFMFEDYPAALLYLCILPVGLIPSLQIWAMRAVRLLGDHPVRVALGATIMLALAARFAYLAHPLSMDEYAAFFQSRAFAAGRLSGQFPPEQLDWLVPRFFQNVFFVVSRESGHVASAYWPGFALILAPFSAIGVPWLCNPVIGGLTIIAIHRLAMDLFEDRAAAGMAILVLLASTAFTINAISFYSMPAHLLFNLLFAIAVLRKSARSALLAGLIGGWALVLHNPYPHMLFAVPWLVWLACQRNGLRLLGAAIAGYVPVILVLGVGWSYFLLELRSASAGGFAGAEVSVGTTIARVIQSARNIFRVPLPDVFVARAIGLAKVWLWATPGLLVLAAWGYRKRNSNAALSLLAISALVTFVGYLFYPADQGHGWGFRYVHSAWFALPILAVAPLLPSSDAREASHVTAYFAACALASALVMNGLRLHQVHEFISTHKDQVPTTQLGEPVLIILNVQTGYYQQDLVQNEPFLRSHPILAVTRGKTLDAEFVAAHYPELELLESNNRGQVWGYPKK